MNGLYIYLSKQKRMATKNGTPKKRGRKKIKVGDKKAMLPLYAKKKHHQTLKEQFKPLILDAEEKLDKEVKQ